MNNDDKSLLLWAVFGAAALAGGYALIRYVLDLLASLPDPATVRVLLVGAILTLPVAVAFAFQAGKAVGLRDGADQHYQEGREAGLLVGRVANRRHIEQLREETQERGDAFLDGAKRGLGIADKLVKTRETARPAKEPTQQVAVVLPQVGAGQFTIRRSLGDGEVIDL